MQGQDTDDTLDEQTVEISTLREDENLERDWTRAGAARRVPLRQRYTLRQRWKQVLISGAIFLVLLLVLLANVAPVRTLIAARFAKALPAHHLLSGPGLYYFQTLPSWGIFSLDGKRLSFAPIMVDVQPLRLSAGKHVLAWRAEPFMPLSCVLIVPPAIGLQSCHTRDLGQSAYARDATLVEFPTPVSLNLLSMNQRQALMQTVQHLLDSLQGSEIVQPGEYYTRSMYADYVHIATEPLRATLRFLLETNPNYPAPCEGATFGRSCTLNGNDCRLFCTMLWPVSNGWHVAAIIRTTWTYTTLDGRVLPAPDNALIGAQGDQHFVTFRVTWQKGAWQAAFHPQGESSFDDPNCITTIGALLSQPTYNFIPHSGQLLWMYVSGANRAQGCLAAAGLPSAQLSRVVTPVTADVYVLQRFGVLLAGNELAHELWPALPVVDKVEQHLVAEIAQHEAFVS